MNPNKGRKFGMGGMKASIANPQTRRGKMQMPNAKIRKYANGGGIDPTKLEDEDNARRESEIMDTAKAVPSMPQGNEPKTRGEAFKAARKDGQKQFEWPPGSGKMYHTRTAEEEKKRSPAAPTPKALAPAPKAAPTPTPPRAAAAAPAGRYTTRGGGSAPSGAGGLGFESLKAKRDDFYAKMEARRKAMGMKEPAKPDLSLGQIPALKARSDDFYAKMEARRKAMGMGDQPAPDLEVEGATYAKGGAVESKKMMKKELSFMKNKGAPKSMVKHEMAEAKGMKRGGMACGGGMKKYARGGGVESHGKTKGTMIKMASGGSVSSRADGIAQRGKTNCKIC